MAVSLDKFRYLSMDRAQLNLELSRASFSSQVFQKMSGLVKPEGESYIRPIPIQFSFPKTPQSLE